MSSKEDFSHNFKKLLPGAIASLITQPLEVIKTNMINSPTQKFAQLHGEIVGNGYRQYMRGTYIFSDTEL